MVTADYLEVGGGPLVILIHSSVAGARQWRRLMDDLEGEFHLRAVNLYGYGANPPWPDDASQTLEDQARLVETALPPTADNICVVGHSFGGSVAMKLATRIPDRISRLVLLETNPFYLLKQAARDDAFAEAMNLRNHIKMFGARGDWLIAAQGFADYWNGPRSWQEMSESRRAAFAEALRPNYYEWDAVMDETTTAEEWAQLLPAATLLVCDPGTVRPIREIDEILRQACPKWSSAEVSGVGHMAPLTRPDIINPMVATYLRQPQARKPRYV